MVLLERHQQGTLRAARHARSGPSSRRGLYLAQDHRRAAGYFEAIVGSLKKAGLVDSSRGKEGGYSLLRPPEEYSVGEILRCTEDKLAPVSCITAEGVACAQASACLTLPMWRELDELTNAYLDSVTLLDLLDGSRWRAKDRKQ